MPATSLLPAIAGGGNRLVSCTAASALPQARGVGMRPLPWLVLIMFSGCIGLFAMIARLLYLRENATPAA